MANPNVVILALKAAVTNGIATSQTPASAGNLTLNGSLATAGVATMDVARRVSIASTGSDAAVIFTVYGTNGSGAPISSPVTGVVSGTPVATALDFLTVTRISVSGATAGAITAGTNGVGSTPWVIDDFTHPFWALSVAVSVSGTINYTVEHTYDDPNAPGVTLIPLGYQFSIEPASNKPPIAWPNSTLTAQTDSKEAQYSNQPIFAHRLTINSGTGTAVMQSIQSGLGGF